MFLTVGCSVWSARKRRRAENGEPVCKEDEAWCHTGEEVECCGVSEDSQEIQVQSKKKEDTHSVLSKHLQTTNTKYKINS